MTQFTGFILTAIICLISVTRAERDAVYFQQSAYLIPPSSPTLLLDPASYSHPFNEYYTHTNTYTNTNTNITDTNSIQQQESELPCQPRQIHLSLGNRQNDTSKTGMHLSFSIPNYISSHPEFISCSPDRIIIEIQYGIQKQDSVVYTARTTQAHALVDNMGTYSHSYSYAQPSNHDNNDGKININTVPVVRQYDTTSPITLERYSSDYLYHTALDGLNGDTDYWYTIQVLKQIDPFDHWQSQPQVVTKARRQLRSSERTGATHVNTDHGGESWRKGIVLSTPTRRIGFRTAPTATTVLQRRKPVKLAIVGDLGQTYNSTVTMLNILSTMTHNTNASASVNQPTPSTPVTALLIAGDMSYANSIQPQWDNWFNLMEPIVQHIPMMVAAGNHEIECDAKSHFPFLAYENRFFMPNRIKDATIQPVSDRYWNNTDTWGCATPSQFIGQYDYGNAFYGFEYGWVKTIVLSSYSDTRKGSNQYEWLVEELEVVDREETPWLVIMMHTQFYTTFKAHNDEEETIIMRQAMEELFLHHHVNLVFSGHDHAYMRSKPMFEGGVVENGRAPIYMIVGEGGNREKHVKHYLNKDQEEWVAMRDKSVYGFGTLEVVNATSAQWIWNMGEKYNGFQDEVWIHNQYL